MLVVGAKTGLVVSSALRTVSDSRLVIQQVTPQGHGHLPHSLQKLGATGAGLHHVHARALAAAQEHATRTGLSLADSPAVIEVALRVHKVEDERAHGFVKAA